MFDLCIASESHYNAIMMISTKGAMMDQELYDRLDDIEHMLNLQNARITKVIEYTKSVNIHLQTRIDILSERLNKLEKTTVQDS